MDQTPYPLSPKSIEVVPSSLGPIKIKKEKESPQRVVANDDPPSSLEPMWKSPELMTNVSVDID